MFNKYPYTDFHELNTDWIISKIKNVETAETNAKEYAETAENARDTAVDAKDTAVQAKDDTVTAKDIAVQAKDDAEQAKTDAQSIVADTNNQIQVLQARVDNIIPDGTQTAGNTELIDIRTAADGTIYSSAGDAVRGQAAALQSAMHTLWDTNPLSTAKWMQGIYSSIYTDPVYRGDQPTRICVHVELPEACERVTLSITNPATQYVYGFYDASMNPISGSAAWHQNTLTVTGDIKHIYLNIKEVIGGVDQTITPSYANEAGVKVVIDGKYYSLYEVSDAIQANAEYIDNVNTDLFGKRVSDSVSWAQGSYGAIDDYEAPLINSVTTRIRSQFEITSTNDISIFCDDPENYVFGYSVFDEDGALISGDRSWHSNPVYVQGPNIKTVRIMIRRLDNTNIAPSDYASTGIYCMISTGQLPALKSIPVKLTIMSYNLGRFNYGVSPYYLDADFDTKLANYKSFFSAAKADFLGLQECNKWLDNAADDGTRSANDEIFNYLYPYHHDVNGNVSMKSKYPFEGTGSGTLTAGGRTYLYGFIELSGKIIFVMDVHLTPNEGEEQEAQRALERAAIVQIMSQHDYAICCGDFNAHAASDYEDFTNAGLHIANGGYLPIQNTYGGRVSFSEYYPFDNIVTTGNIIIDDSGRANVFDALSSDHLPFIANLTIY